MCLNCFYFLLGIGSRIVVVLELGVLFGGVFIEILGGAAMTYKGVNQILYGGDYNPEQWAEEVWLEDMQIMKQAHIKIVTLNVFSWAALQPDEDTYCFERLDRIMNLLRENGFLVCMATSTGAHPAWMAKRHPDILRTDGNGRKRKFGGRHNSCPNSPTYRLYASRLAKRLAKRYKGYSNIVAWHVSNEYGGTCYCENCEKAFREWLKRKYKTLEEMNRCFFTDFWGHTFYDWDEVVLPNLLSEHFIGENGEERTMFQGISLDYMRFISDSMLECFQIEYRAIREEMPDIPITTNLTGADKNLDSQKWAKQMDFVSWDSYPRPSDSAAETAMSHDIMRGLKGQMPFVLMEQTPSVTNWQPYNKLKRPKEMRLLSYQAAAHGADAIQFFQIRRGKGACEKFHGAVIDHAGRTDTRVFQEVAQLGQELELLNGAFLESKTPSQAAILFDWDNWWAVEYSAGPSILIRYLDVVKAYYTALFEDNISVDFIGAEDELENYKIVIAPLLYMVKTGLEEKIEHFTENGGCFITGYFSGIVDEHDLVLEGGYPGTLKEVLGIWVQEQDALPKGEKNAFYYKEEKYPAEILCDLILLEGADSVSTYTEDFYQGISVITRNFYGNGTAWYVGTSSSKEFYREFLSDRCREAGISPCFVTPSGVEAAIRKGKNGSFLFLLNYTEQEQEVVLDRTYRDLLFGEVYKGGERVLIEKKDVWILMEVR